MATLNHTQIDFTNSSPVISCAQKFILPVFAGGGEPLVYPAGTVEKDEDVSGKPIVDWEGNPVGETGVVFWNAKDECWQAVPDDGQGIIIINQVTEEQAEQIAAKIGEYADDPNKLTLAQLKEVLRYVCEDLGIGDMYNSDRGFWKKRLTLVDADNPPTDGEGKAIEAYGLHKRDDRDICPAVYVAGEVTFDGTVATDQKFPDGVVIVRVGEDVQGVQPDTFAETYLHADGREIKDPAAELVAVEV